MPRFKPYLQKEGANFSATELITIMDSFKEPLHSHLRSEPPSVVALSKYSTPGSPIDILGIANSAGKKQLSLGFVFSVLSVFFLNMDTVEFEGGMWHEVFRPLKGIAKWIMFKAVPIWNPLCWRFVSCSPEGKEKQLAL